MSSSLDVLQHGNKKARGQIAAAKVYAPNVVLRVIDAAVQVCRLVAWLLATPQEVSVFPLLCRMPCCRMITNADLHDMSLYAIVSLHVLAGACM